MSVLLSEICSGNMHLLLCDESCTSLEPRDNNYKFYADREKLCSTKGGARALCMDNPVSQPSISVTNERDTSYFVGVKGGGSYQLVIRTLKESGKQPMRPPILVAPEGDDRSVQ